MVAMVRRIVDSLVENGKNLDLDAQLMDNGLDSLGATELSTMLSRELSMMIPATVLFSYPTMGDIVRYLCTELDIREVGERSIDEMLDMKTGSVAVRNYRDRHLLRDMMLMRGGMDEKRRSWEYDTAIVGTSCRLPGDICDMGCLWEMLIAGRDGIREASLSRWDTDAMIAMSGSMDMDVLERVRFGGFLSEEVLYSFEGSRFGISAAEASHMDIAQQLLLTVSYEALLDAGLTKETMKGRRIGVFVGASGVVGDGVIVSGGSDVGNSRGGASVYDATGKTLSVAAGRISYVLGLCGPCSAVDTACSSSLVALHSARRSLQLGECDMAVVACENVLSAQSSLACAVAGMTSADGRCHVFDASAQGYGRGEGCGALVLKRMSEAVSDEDGIYAIVRGSAVMQDGKSASLTAPNGLAQEELLRTALQDAGLEPREVSVIEAHGTGTKLGDPVETSALAAVYGLDREEWEPPLYVTSVKANIGHLEAAAGLAGVMSAMLTLHHKEVPPNAQLREMNEEVARSVAGTRLVFPTEATALDVEQQEGNRRLIAGISSFGYSGTIAHVLIEEAPTERRRMIQQILPSRLLWSERPSLPLLPSPPKD